MFFLETSLQKFHKCASGPIQDFCSSRSQLLGIRMKIRGFKRQKYPYRKIAFPDPKNPEKLGLRRDFHFSRENKELKDIFFPEFSR